MQLESGKAIFGKKISQEVNFDIKDHAISVLNFFYSYMAPCPIDSVLWVSP